MVFRRQKRLDKAIASLPDIDVSVSWRPFQLDPTIPPEGKDRKEYMRAKFGDERPVQQIHARLEETGRAEGIAFDFDAIKVSPNTLDAHRLIRWAASAGELSRARSRARLFQLYFEEGKNIGDHAVLIEAARECGMDAAVVARASRRPTPTRRRCAHGDRHRQPHGRYRRAVLPHRGALRGDGRAGHGGTCRSHPQGVGSKGTRRVGEGGRVE